MQSRDSHPIHSAEDIQALAEQLSSHPMIAIDTEFIRESTFFPILALVQVATKDRSWLVDPLRAPRQALEPLLRVFQNPGILKILHSAQADQECLYSSFGIVAAPSFDTAVGASFCGLGESISLAKLVREMTGAELEKGHARTDWTKRPLPAQLLRYAHADVKYMVSAAEKLFSKLDALGRRQWALEMSARFEDVKLYSPDPVSVAQRLMKNSRMDARMYGVFVELVAWREDRAREINIPRRRVADDDVLMDLARTRPADMEHLQAFRGLNRGELRNSGGAILQAIARGLSNAAAGKVSVPVRPEPASDQESRALELLLCLARAVADENAISLRLLLNQESALEIVRRKPRTLEDLKAMGVLSNGAVDLLGTPLLDLLAGNLSLGLKNGAVRVSISSER